MRADPVGDLFRGAVVAGVPRQFLAGVVNQPKRLALPATALAILVDAFVLAVVNVDVLEVVAWFCAYLPALGDELFLDLRLERLARRAALKREDQATHLRTFGCTDLGV